jgi:8-amino-7-oxononanoate synthase
MATLGKAVGVHGAFVAAHGAVIEWLVNRSRTYIYTTAMPPDTAAIIVSNIERMRTQSWRRERLHANVARFRQSMQARNHPLLPSRTAIQPYMVGSEDDALALMRDLEMVGLYVPAIRPPTVPAGGSRLRISISALHEAADIDRLVSALEDSAHAR